jgi:Uma2 family endonuclease
MPEVAAFELALDWVCEVLSLSTQRFDRSGKVPIYAREGVLHVWFIYEIHRVNGKPVTPVKPEMSGEQNPGHRQ